MSSKNNEAKALARKIAFRLIAEFIAYTMAFGILAFALNATVVPRIADMVADNTSHWYYWDKTTYSLDDCLNILDGHLLAVGESWENKEELDSISKAVEDQMLKSASSAVSEMDLQYKTYIDPNAYFENDLPYIPILVSIEDGTPEWTMLSSLRSSAAMKEIRSEIESDIAPQSNPNDWQFLETETNIEGRDLSVYNAVRSFKLPLACAFYLIGYIVIVALECSRLSKYFDALTSAVRSVLMNKDEPVELPKELMATQSKLNEIRLSAIADENAAIMAERRKDELVTYLAHDIKTPLTSVIGYLSLLDEAPELPDDIRRRYVKTAYEKSERLETLIDEFFEITRYNLHAIPIERQGIDLKTLCLQVADEFYPACSAKGISIAVDAPENGRAFVDPEKMARALGNVVRNAVSYADPDTVVHIVASLGDTIIIEVSDTGREISPSHLESIFDKFYREDASRHAGSGNSGLGLAIAKEIVNAHKGTISAKSANRETVFTIRLPK